MGDPKEAKIDNRSSQANQLNTSDPTNQKGITVVHGPCGCRYNDDSKLTRLEIGNGFLASMLGGGVRVFACEDIYAAAKRDRSSIPRLLDALEIKYLEGYGE
jgi:hypothetical protein